MIPLLEPWTRIARRSDEREILDGDGFSDAELVRSLADMERCNRLLGGVAALRRLLLPRIERAARQGPVRVLEAGCGAAGMSRWLREWARRRDLPVEVCAIDIDPRRLLHADRSIPLVCGDLLAPPFRDSAADIVFSTLVLHHLTPDQVARAVGELDRLAGRAVILNDLCRDRTPLAFYRLAGPALRLSAITRSDGAASIRRAYTADELREIVAGAGYAHAVVRRHWPAYRLSIVIDKVS